MSSDEDELLLEQLLDVSVCSDDDLSIAGSSLLDSESLLDGPDLAPIIDVHPTPTESIESSKVKEDNGASKPGQPVIADVGGKVGVLSPVQPCGTKKSKIIKLNQTRKFRYVPVELPAVELPPYARKYPRRKRSGPNPKHTARAAEPDILLSSPVKHRRVSDGDLYQKIVSNTQRKPKRRITVDSPVRSRVLPSTAPELKSVMAETGQSTTPELKTVMVETLPSSIPELKNVAVNTPHSKHDITVNSLGLDFHAEKGNSIFVSRPAIVSKNSGSFSLQHLGQSPFTFSLDHLRSE